MTDTLFDAETLFDLPALPATRNAPVGEYPMVRRSDPVSSAMAATNAKVNAVTLRARCLSALRAHPEGLTDFVLAELVGSQQTSAGKRRGELVKQGLVCNSGLFRPAPSGHKRSSGRPADVNRPAFYATRHLPPVPRRMSLCSLHRSKRSHSTNQT